jgi:lipoprotein-anchoring transpeptidase ErfK/SrfK
MRRLIITAAALVMIGTIHPAGAAPGGGISVAETPAPAAAEASAASVIAAAPAKPAPPAITLTANINLTTQRMTVQVHGKPVHTWSISSGARGHETPTGNFKPQWQSKLWHSRTYDNAPMPHAVFFNDGIAVHATTSVGRLGSPASHGCIRLSPANAAQFYALVGRHGNSHTKIAVTGRPHFNDEMASRRSRNQMAQTNTRSTGYQQYDGRSYYSNQPQPARVIYRAASNQHAPAGYSTTKSYRY